MNSFYASESSISSRSEFRWCQMEDESGCRLKSSKGIDHSSQLRVGRATAVDDRDLFQNEQAVFVRRDSMNLSIRIKRG